MLSKQQIMPQLQEHGFLETDQSNNEVCNLKYENTRKTNYFYRIEFQARGAHMPIFYSGQQMKVVNLHQGTNIRRHHKKQKILKIITTAQYLIR
jgi:hypothetical protein